MKKLKQGELVTSPVSGIKYKIGEVLGAGGFGCAYRAWELGRRNQPVDEVCLKTTQDQTSWHRESYFGELLTKSKRVIQTYDSFPLFVGNSRRGELLFCLVLELAEAGTVADHLEQTKKPWRAGRAKKEIIALLKVLDQLHSGSATHRDLTPMNVFVCRGTTLKLGDFGIARHQLAGKPVTVNTFNPAFVTKGFLTDEHRHWLAVDDVFQMGQLLAMLLRGDAESTISPADVSKIDCDDALKAIIKRAIGPRKRRFADAFEMLRALEGKTEVTPAPIRSLRGKTVVFTGPLSIKRFDAEVLALQAGAAVASGVSKTVDVVVQGGRSPLYRSGHKGRKLQLVQKLIKQGHTIHVIGEAEFRRLTRPSSKR